MRDFILIVIFALFALALMGLSIYAVRVQRRLRGIEDRIGEAAQQAEHRDTAKKILHAAAPIVPRASRHLRSLKIAAPFLALWAWLRRHPAPAAVTVGTAAAVLVLVPSSHPPGMPHRHPPTAAPPPTDVRPPRTVTPGKPLDPGGPPASVTPITPPAAGTRKTPTKPTHAPTPARPSTPRSTTPPPPAPPTCRIRLRVGDVVNLCVPDPLDPGALTGQPKPIDVQRPTG